MVTDNEIRCAEANSKFDRQPADGKGERMNDRTLSKHLEACRKTIESLPATKQDRLWTLFEETYERHREIQEATNRALDSLDDWRLRAKYLVFDFEARQRDAQQNRSQYPPSTDA